MTNITLQRPAVLAAEINTIKAQTMRAVLTASIEIGNCLAEAKAIVPYGDWEQWLEDNVDYSQSTADNLMRIAKEYGDNQIDMFSKPKSQTFGELTYSQAVALFALPAHEREEFVETHDMNELSVRDLNEEINRLKKEKAALENNTLDKDNRIEDLNTALELAKTTGRAYSCEKESLAEKLKKKTESEKKLNESIRELRGQLEAEKSKEPVQIDVLSNKPSDEDIAKLRAEITEKLASENTAHTAELENQIDSDQVKLEQLNREYNARVKSLEDEKMALEKRIQSTANSTLQQFSALFEAFQEDFARMERKLVKMRDTDFETANKISTALYKILTSMSERLGE